MNCSALEKMGMGHHTYNLSDWYLCLSTLVSPGVVSPSVITQTGKMDMSYCVLTVSPLKKSLIEGEVKAWGVLSHTWAHLEATSLRGPCTAGSYLAVGFMSWSGYEGWACLIKLSLWAVSGPWVKDSSGRMPTLLPASLLLASFPVCVTRSTGEISHCSLCCSDRFQLTCGRTCLPFWAHRGLERRLWRSVSTQVDEPVFQPSS